MTLLIRVGNLILASLAVLVSLMSELGCHSALSTGPPKLNHGHVTAWEILRDLVVVIWFVGALGLFSRRRLAWFCSLAGTAAAACLFATLLAEMAGMYIFPNANGERAGGGSGVEYGVAIVTLLGQFFILFGISTGLFAGLVRMRNYLR